jgi:TPR repeat protein
MIKHHSFNEFPEKIKATMLELVDTRNALALCPADYFDEMIAHSRLSYWSQAQMPLKIYVPDESHADGFCPFDRNEIEQCFAEWCSLVPGRLDFKMVDDPEHADITFSQKQTMLDLSYSNTVLAHTIPIPSGPERWCVFPASKARIEPLRFQPDIKNYADSRAALRHTVFLHEIGHSLGLIGHSCNANDLMFFSGSGTISERDKATFRRLYAPGNIYERSEKALREQAAKNDKYALVQLALQLDDNGTASQEQLKEIFQLVKRASELGSNKATLMLGWMYKDGNGVKRSLPEAVRCFHKAAEQGSPPALLALAGSYERGDGEKQNLAQAEKYLKLALKMDLGRAPMAYASFLSYQYGDKDNLERAAGFLKRSSAKDQTEALCKLAILYDHGEGVQKDAQEAERLREKVRKQLLQLKANDAVEYFARGCAWNDVCESERAIADFNQAAKLNPNFRAVYLARGAAEQSCGRVKESCADLTNALQLDPDCVQAFLGRAYSNLAQGNAKGALADVNAVLSRTTDPDSDRLYAWVVGALAFRMQHDEAGARAMLEKAIAQSSDKDWPGPIIRFLHHDINESQFMREALGYSRSTEVRFYTAMEQSSSGKIKDAIENLEWVKENGDKTFYEYPVAIGQLERLQKSAEISAGTATR